MTPYRIAAEVPPAPVRVPFLALDDLDDDDLQDDAAAAGRSPVDEHEPEVERTPIEAAPVGPRRAALAIVGAALATTVLVPAAIFAISWIALGFGGAP